MTRKHFKAIAELIRYTDMSDAQRSVLVSRMCSTFRAFNPRFNSAKFHRACFGG